MSTTEERRPPAANNEPSDSLTLLIVLKVIIIGVFVLPLAQYFVFNSNKGNGTLVLGPEETENVSQIELEVNETIRAVRLVIQPSCPRSQLLIVLQDICEELYLKRELCTPEDVHNEAKHRLPVRILAHNNSSTTNETRGTIVGYFAIGLLLTSLGAAFVELYKAKSQIPTKQKKNPLSRKCSLADLTVLKHHRKELIRRESIMEEDGAQYKAAGSRPPPLNRRCSFPVGFIDSRRPSTESRRCSILDSRRESISDGNRRQSVLFDGSVYDDSMERRHWSKLVHRH